MIAQDIFQFDVRMLLAPVSEDSVAGESLRYEGTYDRILEARREDDANLEQGVWKRELKRADWSLVSTLCLDALQKRTKDLQIAAWLLESWIHQHGSAGVRVGCQMLLHFCRTFWDSMYPPADDPDFRAAPIHWMNEKLLTQLKFIPITAPESQDIQRAYTWADWETAFRQESSKPSTEPKKTPTITLDTIHRSALMTPASFYETLADDIGHAYSYCSELEGIFDQALGAAGCSLGQFRGVLESILSLIPRLEGDTTMPDPRDFEDHQGPPYSIESVNHETMGISMLPPIRSRAEAYRRLSEAADYLIRTEPHSPAPYLIRRAISWGGMSLEQLLPELLANDNAVTDVARLLKLQPISKAK